MTCILAPSPPATMSDLHQLSYAADMHRASMTRYDSELPPTSEREASVPIRLPSMRTPPPHVRDEQSHCYWSLLTEDLRFISLDPGFARHIGPNADVLLGRCLLDLVHPHDQVVANEDYSYVARDKLFSGSVTSVRLSRIGRIRRLLEHGSAHQGHIIDVGSNDEYLATDIVINWVAAGVVLCYLHSSHPVYNDEHSREAWYWCSTLDFNADDARVLFDHLTSLVRSVPEAAQDRSCERVFQLLQNTPDRQPLLTWPPDGTEMRTAHGWTSMDYTRVAQDIPLQAQGAAVMPKTNCTRRFLDRRSVNTVGWGPSNLESLLIPHGSIIFTCHRLTQTAPAPSYAPSPTYEVQHTRAHTSPSYFQDRSSQPDPFSSQYAGWQPGYRLLQEPHPASPLRASYKPGDLNYCSSPSSSQCQDASLPEICPPTLPQAPVSAPASTARRRSSPIGTGSAQRELYGGGTRSNGNPPIGVTECVSCGTTTSPEWRRGESGKKDMCNACGLRFARRKAKEQGTTVQRRKKVSVSFDDFHAHANAQAYHGAAAVLHSHSAMRRSSVDSLATTSSYADGPPSSASADTPSPPTYAVDLGTHYAYHTQPVSASPYPQAAYHLPRISGQHQHTYDSRVYSAGHSFAAHSYERLKQEHHS